MPERVQRILIERVAPRTRLFQARGHPVGIVTTASNPSANFRYVGTRLVTKLVAGPPSRSLVAQVFSESQGSNGWQAPCRDPTGPPNWVAMGGLVRCVECETEPLTPGHFCECCGRKLSVAERTTVEANPAPAAPVVEASPRAVPGGPCESCGGPSSDGPLCESCQSAFKLVIDGSTSAPVTAEISHHVEQFAPVTSVSTPAPSAPQSAPPEATMLAPACGESAGASFNTDWSAMNAVEIDPAHRRKPRVRLPLWRKPRSQNLRTNLTLRWQKPRQPGNRVVTRGRICNEIETAYVEAAATEPEPVRVTENPAVSAQQSTAQWMGLAAAAVIAVAVMGVPLGVWLGTRHQAQPEPRQAAAPGVQKAAVAAAPVPAASAPTKVSEVLPTKPQAAAVAQPNTAAPVSSSGEGEHPHGRENCAQVRDDAPPDCSATGSSTSGPRVGGVPGRRAAAGGRTSADCRADAAGGASVRARRC